jgi:hypothetical protein
MRMYVIRLFFLLSILFSVGFFAYAFSVSAQGLVPCGTAIETTREAGYICYTGECSVCHIQILILNIMDFFVGALAVIASLLFIHGGFLYLTSAGNSGKLQKARSVLVSTTIGIFFVLGAWLLVDVVMRTFYAGEGTGWGPWNEFLCQNAALDAQGQKTVCFPEVDAITLEAEYFEPEDLPMPTTLESNMPAGSSYCSVGYLSAHGWPSESLNMATCICMRESAGGRNPAVSSTCDKCAGSNIPISFGIWQMNLSAHNIGNLRCSDTIVPPYGLCRSSSPCQCKTCDVPVAQRSVYEQCKQYATNAGYNSTWAANLYKRDGWRPWGYSYRKCREEGVR